MKTDEARARAFDLHPEAKRQFLYPEAKRGSAIGSGMSALDVVQDFDFDGMTTARVAQAFRPALRMH